MSMKIIISINVYCLGLLLLFFGFSCFFSLFSKIYSHVVFDYSTLQELGINQHYSFFTE